MSSSKEMLANKSDNNNIRQIESDKNSSNSKTLINFYPITKSMSVPDVNKNSPINSNNLKLETNLNDLLQTNSGSIESAIADSPAGSIEQFEATVNTPLSTDDPVDSLIDTLRFEYFVATKILFKFLNNFKKSTQGFTIKFTK
jgi:hypothetical protein